MNKPILGMIYAVCAISMFLSKVRALIPVVSQGPAIGLREGGIVSVFIRYPFAGKRE